MSKLSTQNKWILVVFAFVIINVAAWYFGLAPSIEKVSSVSDTYEKVEKQKTNMETILAQLDAINVDSLEEQKSWLAVKVPSQGQVIELLYEIEDIAILNGIKVNNLQASDPTILGNYIALDLSLLISGSYLDVYSYLEFLEQHERFLKINSFSLRSSEGLVEGSLQIRVIADSFDSYTPHTAPGRSNPFGSH